MKLLCLTMLIAAVTLVTDESLSQTVWEVPGDRNSIAEVVAELAEAYDVISVVDSTTSTRTQPPFTVSIPLTITNVSGETISIEATTSWAVNVTTASGATIDGFRIVGARGRGLPGP